MARPPSTRKIPQSLWRNLFRRRRRDHAVRAKAQRRVKVSRKTAGAPKVRRPLRRFVKPAEPIPPVPIYVHAARLSIALLGSGAIIGTAMSFTQSSRTLTVPPVAKTAKAGPPLGPIALTKENVALRERLETLNAKYPDLKLHLIVWEPTSGSYVNLEGTKALSAASTIKIPIALALMQQVDRGQIKLDEKLTLQKSQIAAGSGEFGQQSVGSTFSVKDTLTAALTDSDNTASNMLIDRLGGISKLNIQWHNWGLVATKLRAPLPDFLGTNQTSAKELALLLNNLQQGYLLKAESRKLLLEIMGQTKRNTMLPAGVEKGKVAHKTGELETLIADAGRIELANGKKYLVVALVQRPANDDEGEKLIRQVSETVYAEYTRSTILAPATVPSP
jgi:beta-lactamase class A